MNEVTVECKECHERLIIANSQVNFANDILFEVTPCGCTNTDCSTCDDLKILKAANIKLSETVNRLNEKLATIKAFFISEKQPDQGYQPDETSPAQDTNLPSDKDTLDPEPVEPKLDTNIKHLPATEDVVSTGGAIIPGIKKGSAEGVVAEYGKPKGDKSGTHK